MHTFPMQKVEIFKQSLLKTNKIDVIRSSQLLMYKFHKHSEKLYTSL